MKRWIAIRIIKVARAIDPDWDNLDSQPRTTMALLRVAERLL